MSRVINLLVDNLVTRLKYMVNLTFFFFSFFPAKEDYITLLEAIPYKAGKVFIKRRAIYRYVLPCDSRPVADGVYANGIESLPDSSLPAGPRYLEARMWRRNGNHWNTDGYAGGTVVATQVTTEMRKRRQRACPSRRDPCARFECTFSSMQESFP